MSSITSSAKSLRSRLLGFLAVASLLSACGSRNDAPPPIPAPAAPNLGMSFGIKEAQLNWNAVTNATHYRLWESKDGVVPLAQVGGDLTVTSAKRPLALHLQVNAKYRVQACNSGGCTSSATVTVADFLVSTDSLQDAVGFVKASNTRPASRFGHSVAISADGSTLAVGSYGESSGATGINGNQSDVTANASGAVYVFTRAAGAWEQQAYIKASNSEVHDRFGWSVALNADGSTLAVSSYLESGGATGVGGNESDNGAFQSGAVYVFRRTGLTWAQQAYVKASNVDPYDNFGVELALSADGNTLAVGAMSEKSSASGINGNQLDNSMIFAGAVYVFTRSGDAWTQQAYVKASNTRANSKFGRALAISADGNTLAVGAPEESSSAVGIGGDQLNTGAPLSGAVYVFLRNAGAWTQQAYLKASNTRGGDNFGRSVALSADGATLAVGAWGESSASSGINGSQSGASAPGSGAAYVFTRGGSAWSQQAYIKASNARAGSSFGISVSLSSDGSMLAVGADGEASGASGMNGVQVDTSAPDSGAAYMFSRVGTTWKQETFVKPSNTRPSIGFGRSLAMSADGAVLAVGAAREASGSTGIGGDQSDASAEGGGAVYLY